MNTPKDGGPAFPITHAGPWDGMSLRYWLAGMAMQGLLSCESDEHSHYYDTRTDPNTGKETFRTHVYPLDGDGKEDYSKGQIACPPRETAAQRIARLSHELADAMLAEGAEKGRQ